MWSVVLVEGDSDRAALETLAPPRGLDLATAGVRIPVRGGATGVGQVLARYAVRGVRLTERDVRPLATILDCTCGVGTQTLPLAALATE